MDEKNFYDGKAEELLGIEAVYPYQRLVIHHLLSVQGYWDKEEEQECCRENLVIFPTGMGKSLCFMLPGMLLDGITVVVYPLISLMEDQYRRLKQRGIKAGLLKGEMTAGQKRELKRNCKEGSIKFLLTNPEMCGGPLFQELADYGTLCQLIIDEVHTLLHWGESFRPAMLQMGSVLESCSFKGIHYFTATLTKEEEIRLHQLLRPSQPWNCIRSPADRPNLRYFFIEKAAKDRAAAEILQKRGGCALLFCRTRLGTEECCRELRFRLKEKEIFYYHAGLPTERKRELEDWFLRSKEGIMVATKAYGMGVDKPNIRLVLHRDFPEDISSYLQEAGRAGRDGKTADSIVLIPGKNTKINSTAFSSVLQGEGCRRALVFKEMGETLESCGGCDYCSPLVWTPQLDRDKDQLIQGLPRISGLMNFTLLQDFFQGLCTPTILKRKFHYLPAFGRLKHWEREDLRDCLKSLEKKTGERGKWIEKIKRKMNF